MNIVFWILQILLAFHTAIGAVWKLTNSEQSVPSLNAIPHSGWMVLCAIEILCAIFLVLPAFKKNLKFLAPFAALIITIEMLMFCALHLASGDSNYGPMIYWLVVAALSLLIAVYRFLRRNK